MNQQTGASQPNSGAPVPAQAEAEYNPYQQTALEIGAKVGPHQVQQLIGEGGVANVYKVWHSGLEVVRALKMLKKGFNQEARERFLTEAKILADISHPNIIEIHSIGYYDQQIPFLEMEFIDGFPIGKLISMHKRLPLAVSVSITYFVSQALHYAHTKDYTLYGKVYHGLIHRDIKPDNIFLSKDGIVKLMDFGIARPTEISLHTVGDKIMGTLVYLSPEQLSGQQLDHRTDIFSLGCVLYEMITGERAFPQKKLSDLVQAKTKGEYRAVDSFGFPVPASLKQVLDKSMAQDRNSRFASTADFSEALYAVLREYSPLSPQHVLHQYAANPLSIPPWTARKSRHARGIVPALVIVGGIAVIAAAVVVVLKLLP
jgi:serine/threonine protein kinase